MDDMTTLAGAVLAGIPLTILAAGLAGALWTEAPGSDARPPIATGVPEEGLSAGDNPEASK
jgi:hypothetical protein